MWWTCWRVDAAGEGSLVVVDPVSIGTVVAVLAGRKVVDAVGSKVGEAGWGLGNKLLDRVRSWLRDTDEDVERALGELEAAEDPSDGWVAELAQMVDARLVAAPKVAQDLTALVELVRQDPDLALLIPSEGSTAVAGDVINQQASGDRSIQVGKVEGDFNSNLDSD